MRVALGILGTTVTIAMVPDLVQQDIDEVEPAKALFVELKRRTPATGGREGGPRPRVPLGHARLRCRAPPLDEHAPRESEEVDPEQVDTRKPGQKRRRYRDQHIDHILNGPRSDEAIDQPAVEDPEGALPRTIELGPRRIRFPSTYEAAAELAQWDRNALEL